MSADLLAGRSEVYSDVRQQKTWAKLSQAVLELTSVRPATAVSVAEVAARAGVSRSTFYAHAGTAGALLSLVMLQRMSAAAESVPPGRLTHHSAETVAHEVVRHVEAHLQVYRVSLQDELAAAPLYSVIVQHVLSRIRQPLFMTEADATVVAAACAMFIRRAVAHGSPYLWVAVRAQMRSSGLLRALG